MASIQSTNNNSNVNTSRITGLVSGLDTDALVKSMMDAARIPLNKLYQQKQLAEWRRDAYREVSNSLRAFNDKYFDILNKDSYMLSASTYKAFKINNSNSSAAAVSASSSAMAGTHTLVVNNLATSASYSSALQVTKGVTASAAANYADAVGKDFKLTLDGQSYTITIDETVTDLSSLQALVDKQVGGGKVLLSEDAGGCLNISEVADSGVYGISVSGGATSALNDLGFALGDNLSNRLNKSDTLAQVSRKTADAFTFDEGGYVNLTINGKTFAFSATITLQEMMEKINDSDAGVTMKYDDMADTFSLISEKTGAGNTLSISETGSSFLTGAKVTQYTEGKDAVITLDGQKITRSSNTITKDGITYKLLQESTEEQIISLSSDTDAVYDKIVNFINDYNKLVEDLNKKIDEEYDRGYPPLTSEQKEDMTDEEIEKWEEKAKTGLLRNDTTIQTLLTKMRQTVYSVVDGVGVTFTKIGITTSKNYEDKGKLVIDEKKLKEALEEDADSVMNLFCRSSTSHPGLSTVRTLDSTQRSIRTAEEGIAFRLFDILQDNISTYRNSSDRKGTLIEMAGFAGDSSEFNNIINDNIDDYQDRIDEMLVKLEDKEEYYYNMFSVMESYINTMNSQLSILQYFSSGG